MTAWILSLALAAAPDAGTTMRFSDPAAVAAANALEQQTGAWNQGDLESFCAIYAQDAVFISPSGVRRGRADVLAGYRKKYTSKEVMGTLSLDMFDARVAEGGRAVTIAARWTLRREKMPDATGLTLLALQLKNGAWIIVQDASM